MLFVLLECMTVILLLTVGQSKFQNFSRLYLENLTLIFFSIFSRVGGIFCECRAGFTSFAGVGTWEDPCWDINECSQTEKTVCDERTEICANTIGSFICVPLPGFEI